MPNHPPTDLAWFNGKIVSRETAAPSIASNSFHMATGVFDGIMAYWNVNHYYLHRAKDHLTRFKNGSRSMDLDFPWTAPQLEEGIHELLRHCENRTYYIRPISFRGGTSVPAITWRNIDTPVDVCIFGVPVERDQSRPMSCQISPIQRVSSRAMPVLWKACGVYVNSFLAQQRAEESGFDTGIMLDSLGRIAEAPTSNIFFVDDRGLTTPSLTKEIFPGITRQVVLDIAAELSIRVSERDVYPSELPKFNAAFLCATLIELRPVTGIDEFCYSSGKNEPFEAILERFQAITHQ